MGSIDIGLFDYDRHNALYYFVLNADEQIYLRYGGRDAESATTYLNLRSLELALSQGLEMHASGNIPKTERPEPLFASQIPKLNERTLKNGACVECHLIADYQNIHRELDGELDRLRDMYRSPDIKTIGIHLDVPAGLRVKSTTGAAQEAGMLAGDLLTHLNGTRIRTFGDLQYYYDLVPREDKHVSIDVRRDDKEIHLKVSLPARWWLTDLTYRHWSVEPMVYFTTEPLSELQKSELGLPLDGFAGRVTDRDRFQINAQPPLKAQDVICAVNGIQIDKIANTPELYIKLRCRAGDSVRLEILRGDTRLESTLGTVRQNFRKY